MYWEGGEGEGVMEGIGGGGWNGVRRACGVGEKWRTSGVLTAGREDRDERGGAGLGRNGQRGGGNEIIAMPVPLSTTVPVVFLCLG